MPEGPIRRTLRERHPQRLTRQRQTEARPNANARGYGYRWQRYVDGYKKRHPLCRACDAAGKTTPTECVDHITPVTGPDDSLFWKPSNHQPLCTSCHSIKTMTEDVGRGRRA